MIHVMARSVPVVDGGVAVGAARAALRQVDVNPRAAKQRAEFLLTGARAAGDHEVAAVAGRAAGLAAVHLDDLAVAARLVREAVLSARRAGSPALACEVRITQAFVQARLGRPEQALRTIETAREGLTGVERLHATVQRGILRLQRGQLDEALADFRAVLPVLRREQDWAWLQRVYSNRGVLLTYRNQFPAAAADLAEAERICCDHGLALPLALAYDNLGYLHSQRGDVPLALHYMNEAERRHRVLGVPLGTIVMDKAELLLSVRLISEARDAARLAAEEFAALHRGIALPQALLLVADAALLDGDPAGAREAAEQALASFRRQRRTEWVARARYAQLQARLAGAPLTITPAELAAVADDLAAGGWSVLALDARLLAVRVALDRGDQVQAKLLLGQAERARGRGPAQVRVRAWHAQALLRLAEGDRRGAEAALRAGVRVAEEYQAAAGATDVRSSAAGHREALVDLGLGLAVGSRSARRVFAWAERGRASVLLTRPARPPADPEMRELLARLRSTTQEMEDVRTAGRVPEALVRRQVRLERSVRDRARIARASVLPPARPALAEIAAGLGDAALVEYVEHRGELLAVALIGSRVRMVPLGSSARVDELTEHLPFALRRLGLRSTTEASAEAALLLLRRDGARIDELLMRPLRREIGDRPLVVVPTGRLLSLSWTLLPSCTGRPVTVAPSAALWHRAATAPLVAGPALVAAGPALPSAPTEATAVAELYGVSALTGPDATVAAVHRALDGAAVAHIAAHGRFRTDNPLFSSLRLADGPLTVYDLEELRRAPHLVILAACDTGRSAVYAGDELLGLAASLLGLGTVALIASVVPLGDEDTVELMLGLHEQLRRGTSPAAALAQLQATALSGPPGPLAAAAGLVCLGAGLLPVAVRTTSYQGRGPRIRQF